jgi:hypothetical protein
MTFPFFDGKGGGALVKIIAGQQVKNKPDSHCLTLTINLYRIFNLPSWQLYKK